MAGEQVTDLELEVLEVDRRPRALGVGVGAGERVEQGVDEDEHRAGVVVGARLAVGLPRVAVADAGLRLERRRLGAELRVVELGGVRHVAAAPGERDPGLERCDPLPHADTRHGGRELPRGGGGRRPEERRVGRGCRRRDLQARPGGTAAAQRGVGVQDEVAEPRPVGRREVDRLRAPLLHQRVERALEGAAREPLGRELVEHLEARVEPRRQRVRTQHPGAEAVDRADLSALRLAREIRAAEGGEAAADALAQLAGRLSVKVKREDRPDRHVVFEHRAGEALDHHGGLVEARVGGEQPGARAVAVLDRPCAAPG